jgi:hypothetical protein
MAWWSSSDASETSPNAKPATAPSLPSTQTTPPPQNTPPPPTRHPDADFHEAFPHLAPPTPSQSTESQPESQSSNLASAYPTHMSCRAAFDSAFYCTSLGGKFNDIYRYGELRPCTEQWADWRFCMGLKVYGREEKAMRIQDRYREKEEQVRTKPNSEDVWEARGENERVIGAFGTKREEGSS